MRGLQYVREQMEIRTNGNLVFFLATFSRTNGNFSDFLSNETVFHYFDATCSRTNGNLTQNACTKNENGIPFVRERTVARRRRKFRGLPVISPEAHFHPGSRGRGST